MMGRHFAVAAATLALCGCGESPAEKARDRYQLIMKNGGSASEICQAGRDWITALADAGDAGRYRTEKLNTDVTCRLAQMKEGS
jgi:hypothetical protein